MGDFEKKEKAAPSAIFRMLFTRDASAQDTMANLGVRSVMELASRAAYELSEGNEGNGLSFLNAFQKKTMPLATAIARRLREGQLHGNGSHVSYRSHVTGIKALVEGPTYESQFHELWGAFCVPGAPESNQGYLADLASMYRFATAREKEPGDDSANRIPLATRRPDLASLVLDEAALAPKPMLQAVNRMLHALIDVEAKKQSCTVDQLLAGERHPFSLPYERSMAEINFVAGRRDYTLGDFIRLADPDYPYFVDSRLGGERAAAAMRMDTGFGPRQQEILLEPAHTDNALAGLVRRSPRTGARSMATHDTDAFYQRHYGVTSATELSQVDVFCRSTRLRKDDVEQLLAIERWYPSASPNVPGLPSAEPSRFGAVFVNGSGEASIRIATDGQGDFHAIVGASLPHFDRIQRLLRLASWLDLSFSEADRLVSTAIRAEKPDVRDVDFLPTENTVRALGLYRRLRLHFDLSVEHFAGLLEGPGLYAQNGKISAFDAVFNRTDLYSEPFMLDGAVFHLAPRDDELPRIARVCSALGIGLEVFLYLVRFIYQAQRHDNEDSSDRGDPTLTWSYEVVSACLRLTKTALAFGVTAMEAVALLQLLVAGSPKYVGRLSYVQLGSGDAGGLADTLDVIQALSDAVIWCRECNIRIPWLHAVLVPMASPPPTLAYDELIRQVRSSVQGVLLREGAFTDAGLPSERPGGALIYWLSELEVFHLVNDLGMVTMPSDEVDFASYVLGKAPDILKELGLSGEDDNLVKRLAGVLIDHRTAQEAALLEALGSYLTLDVDLVRQVLSWSEVSTEALASDIFREASIESGVVGSFVSQAHGPDASEEPPSGTSDLVGKLTRITIRAEVVSRIGIGAEALRFYLARRSIFDPSVVSTLPRASLAGNLSFGVIFSLLRYQDVVRSSKESEATIIEYLELINDIDLSALDEANLSLVRDHAAMRVASFTGLSIHTVLDMTNGLNEYGVIRNVWEIDRFQRVRRCCDDTLLDGQSVFTLGALDPNASDDAFAQAATLALNALARGNAAARRDDSDEMGQSEQSNMAVEKEVLVARSGASSMVSITVRDLYGRRREGIDVSWNTTLGQLSVNRSTTNSEGVAEVTLTAGDTMGAAIVTATFGLAKTLVAPFIVIDCDEASLEIVLEGDYDPPEEALAGHRERVLLAVSVIDKYGNVGRGRIVRWSADLDEPRFDPVNAVIDEAGMAFTRLSSLRPSTKAAVYAECAANGADERVTTVNFVDKPWIVDLHMDSVMVLGVETFVWCEVRGIDGAPLEGAVVAWSVNKGQATVVLDPVLKDRTDRNGIAKAHVTPKEEAALQLGIKATSREGKMSQEFLSKEVYVYTPVFSSHAPSPEDLIIVIDSSTQATAIRFRVVVTPERAGIGIRWDVDGTVVETVRTVSGGIVDWTRSFNHPSAPKNVVVSAVCGSAKVDYTVKFIKK